MSNGDKTTWALIRTVTLIALIAYVALHDIAKPLIDRATGGSEASAIIQAQTDIKEALIVAKDALKVATKTADTVDINSQRITRIETKTDYIKDSMDKLTVKVEQHIEKGK